MYTISDNILYDNVSLSLSLPRHSLHCCALIIFLSFGKKFRPNDNSRCILATLSVFNIGLSVMISALGVLTMMTLTFPVFDLSLVFLSVYMILFALLLFSYELMWWIPIPWLNKMLRKNFGFMYGLGGKGVYLIFVAFLCLGLANDQRVILLTWGTGLSFLVFGTLHILIPLLNPTLALKYQAPTAGLLAKEYSSGVPNPV
jgi:hypothetical protein